MGKRLKVESLDSLIKEMQNYQIELLQNYQILVNAAAAYDMAVGSDDMSKKQIASMNEALEKLGKTSQIAEQVVDELLKDRKEAIAIYED